MENKFSYLAMLLVFLSVNGSVLAFTSFFKDMNIEVVVFVNSDANDPSNIVFLLGSMLGLTGIILLIRKYLKNNTRVVSGFFFLAVIIMMFSFFNILASLFLPYSVLMVLLPVIGTIIIIALLIKYPEWYVLDAIGIMMAVYTATLLGNALSVFLIIVMFIALIVYDAISVYVTKHMIDLADAVIQSKIPVILYIPKIRNFSLLKETKGLKESIDEGEKRDAFVIGLGDLIFPAILPASIFYFTGNFLLAGGTVTGIMLGLVLLQFLVSKGKPQAGLPFLCGGALLGYFVSLLVIVR